MKTVNSASVNAVIFAWTFSGLLGLLGAFVVGRNDDETYSTRGVSPNWKYAYDQVLAFGSFRIGLLLLGVVSGAAALGQVRLVMVLLGPLNTMVSVIRLSFTPVLSKRADIKKDSKLLFMIVGLIGVSASMYVVLVKFVFMTGSPLIVIKLLPSVELFNLVAASRVAFCMTIGCLLLLRVRGDLRTGRINTVSTVIILVFCFVGSVLDGVDGYALALLAASFLSLAYWLWSCANVKSVSLT